MFSTRLLLIIGLLLSMSYGLQSPVTSEITSEDPKPKGVGVSALPNLIRFSATLRNLENKPISGMTNITFSIYESGESNVPLWLESQSLVVDENGRFSVLLGATSSEGIPVSIFSNGEARWIGIEVQRGDVGEQTRQVLVSVPYAMKAAIADNASSLAGRPVTDFVLNKYAKRLAGDQAETAGPSVEPSAAINNGGTSGVVDFLAKFDSSSTIIPSFVFNSGSFVGIGTTTPSYRLEVRNDLNAETGIALKNRAQTSSGTSQSIFFEGYRDAESTYRIAKISSIHRPGSVGDLNQGSDLAFFTNPGSSDAGLAERFRIDKNGNVGLGTAIPGYRFEVRSDVNSETGIALKNRAQVSSGTSQSIFFEGYRDAEATYRVAKISAIHKPGTAGDLNQGSDLAFSTNPGSSDAGLSERVRIDKNGMVGIGTSTPAYRLEIRNDANTETGIALKNRSTVSSGTSQSIFFEGFRDVEANYRIAKISAIHRPGSAGDLNQGSDLAFFTNPGSTGASLAERVRIDKNGNVGVGTQTPSAKLDVTGGTAPHTASFTQTATGIAGSPNPYYSINTPTAIRGDATSATGVTTAILGTTSSVEGRSVVGLSLYTGNSALRNAGVFGGAVGSETGTGVWGEATNVEGQPALTGDAIGVYGVSSSTSGAGVFGEAKASSGDAVGVAGRTVAAGGTGVIGEAIGSNSGENYGVYGRVENSTHTQSTAGMFINTGSSGKIITGRTNKNIGASNVFSVSITGAVFGSAFNTSGADFAESVAVKEERSEYQPGDVMAIDTTDVRKFTKVGVPYSTLVAGIYSTRPGILASPHPIEDPRITNDEIPLAIVGIVPCKVSNENGPINAGDLLVSSSRPGYAMKGTDRKRMTGAVVGKALQSMSGTTGVIEILVSLQ